MILKDFPGIVMDELPPKPDPMMLYFLSRPMVHTTVYNENNPILIVTTMKIRKFLMSGDNPIPGNYIAVHNNGLMTLAGRDVRLHVIESGSLCCNVMYMFHYDDEPQKQTLYTGQFSEFGNFFEDAQLKEAIRNKTIATMYIDNTMASAATDLSTSKTAEMINDIKKKYPQHRIIVWTEPLGCENVFELLSTECGLKVYLDGTSGRLIKISGKKNLFCSDKSHEIFVTDDLPSYKVETYNDAFKNTNQIILRLVRAERMIVPNIPEKWNGIIDIPYRPHPSAKMIQLLLHRIQPQTIFLTAEYNGECADLPLHVLSSSTTRTKNVVIEDENSGFHYDEAYENEHSSVFKSNAIDGHRVSNEPRSSKKRDILSLSSDEHDSTAMSDIADVTTSPPEKRRRFTPEDRNNKKKDEETNGKPSESNGYWSDVVKFINRSKRVNATANRINYIDSTSDEEEDFGRDDRSVTISIGSSSDLLNPY